MRRDERSGRRRDVAHGFFNPSCETTRIVEVVDGQWEPSTLPIRLSY
jgi:hypothetical protein